MSASSGDDKLFKYQVQEWDGNSWENLGEEETAEPGNDPSVTLGSNQRVIASDKDPTGDDNTDDVQGEATIS